MRRPTALSQGPHARDVDVTTVFEHLSKGVMSYEKKILYSLHEIARVEGLEDFSARRELPGRVFRLYGRGLDLFDASLKVQLAELRRCGFAVKCREVCPNCCEHMPAGVSTIELLGIYHAAHQSGRFARFFRRSLEAEELWERVLCACREHPAEGAPGMTVREEALNRYNRLEHPCPFLARDLCQVYPYRPLACRMHFSLSPPHWCRPSHFQESYAVRFNLEPGDAVLDALERVDARFGLGVSDILVRGFVELTVNVMAFEDVHCDR